MGAVSWGFMLYFDRGAQLRNLEREFVRGLSPYTADGQPPKKVKGRAYYNIYLKLPSGQSSANYSLHVEHFELTLSTDMHILFEEHFVLDDVMLAIAQKMGPMCAISVIETRDTANEHAAMFYRNPYFFLLEPPGTLSSKSIEDFLEDETVLQKISELKRVLPFEELLQLLKKYCKQVSVGERGVGILKGDYSPEEACIYPHYFLRQLVRRRGVHLEEGSAEKYARELGIK